MILKFKKLDKDAVTPTYATTGSGCFDLYSIEEAYVPRSDARTVKTGLAFEIPEGYVLAIFSRSGHGFKYGVRLGNCVGILDSDYRGECMVNLRNDHYLTFHADKGDRIAQAMLLPAPQVGFMEVDELSETQRGAGGFGSTGR
jgi:dUTP pyrophosphatase